MASGLPFVRLCKEVNFISVKHRVNGEHRKSRITRDNDGERVFGIPIVFCVRPSLLKYDSTLLGLCRTYQHVSTLQVSF